MTSNGLTWKCRDCGSENIVAHLPSSPFEADPDAWCHHQHPMGPPGRIISSHLKAEPCALRDSVSTPSPNVRPFPTLSVNKGA